MEVLETESLPIRSSEHVVLVRTAVRHKAVKAKFGLVDQTKIVTAASEIARNTLDYGRGGDVLIEILSDGPRQALRMTFTDKGPGIPDIELALKDGFTTGRGMGLGMSGTKRLVDEFAVISKVQEGTTVTITKWSR
jgi:serine/threonine-protein kinase RsbT